jgi:hypothetical protein
MEEDTGIVDTAPVIGVSTEETVEVKAKRPRNYSFSHKNPETLDLIETQHGSFTIPAGIGSTYWAILKVFYEKHDKRVYCEELLKSVAELMTDRDAEGWKRYCSKESTTVYKKVQKIRSIQKIKPWQERIIGNAKTLTRSGGNSKYGLRLIERGHSLLFGHDENKKAYFILQTKVNTTDA